MNPNRTNPAPLRERVEQRVTRAKKGLGRRIASRWADLQAAGLSLDLAGQTLNVRLQPRAATRSPLALDLETLGAALSAGRPEVGFVQIGAYDGKANDPIHSLIERYGWHGLFIEPQPQAFERLQETYAGRDGVEFLNAAVATQRGEMTMWRFTGSSEVDPPWLRQLASFDHGHLLKHAGANVDLRARIAGEPVPTVTLADVFERAPRPVDVLQIDAEGYDAEILGMLDLEHQRPSIIQFEHRHLTIRAFDGALRKLGGAGYRFSLGEADTIAVCQQS